MGVAIGAAYVTYAYITSVPLSDEATFQEEYAIMLNDYNGKEIRLEKFRGGALLVYTWATWCTYCTGELKNLAMLKEEYGDKITIIAVNRAEPLTDVWPFTEGLGLQDRIVFLLDPTDSFYKDIEGYAMPETLFINARGNVIYHQRGPMKIEEVKEHFKQILE